MTIIRDTKQVLKTVSSDQEDRLKSHLGSQCSFFSSVASKSTLQTIKGASLFVDPSEFVGLSVIAGDILRPDLLLKVHNKFLYILKLTINHETNLTTNIARKDRKHLDLTRTLQHHFITLNSLTFL